MAILIEAISVVIRVETIEEKYPGGLIYYEKDCPNATFCADGFLTRVGFMTPDDVGTFIESLESHGFVVFDSEAEEEEFLDLVVVDQMTGLTRPCKWLSYDRHPDGYAFAWLTGEEPGELTTPEGWDLENSLSKKHEFVPSDEVGGRLRFLRSEEAVDVFRDESTGEEVYIGRFGPPKH
jgi:hypothetical protein